MKKWVFLVALIVCAIISTSVAEGKYKTIETEVVAHAGDTLDGIVAPYYDKCTRKITWQEYRYLQRDLNDNLFKDNRALQIGDVVKVRYYVMQNQ